MQILSSPVKLLALFDTHRLFDSCVTVGRVVSCSLACATLSCLACTDAQVLQRLRTLTQGTYPTLESVDWRLHIQVLVPCQALHAIPKCAINART